MTTFIHTPRRVFGALLTALALAVSAGVLAPAASADTPPTDTVLVPRLTKGATGGLVRVKRDSPEARRYFASVARANAPQSANCPGTVCPQTPTCYTTKGALGAGCVTL